MFDVDSSLPRSIVGQQKKRMHDQEKKVVQDVLSMMATMESTPFAVIFVLRVDVCFFA